MRRSLAFRRVALIGGLAWLCGVAAACHEEGDVHVQSLTIDGNEAATTRQLRNLLVTKATGWLPWAHKRYFNRAAFEADLGRVRRFYQDRGYPDARVTGVDVALDESRHAVRLAITIDEGDPLVVQDVRFAGFEALEESERGVLEGLPVQAGGPRDLDQVAASRQLVLERLRDLGYAYARVDATEQPATAPKQLVVTLTGSLGPRARFGPVTIDGLNRLEERVLLRELTFRPGQMYEARRIAQSQRRLTNLDLLQFVNIDARAPEGAPVLDVPVKITVTESLPRRLQLGAGYGSEGGVRGSIDWSHLNFFGDARHLQASAKGSLIERGASVDVTQPYFFRRGLSLDARASAWWTVEDTYTSKTLGGRVGVRFRVGGRGRGAGRRPGRPAGDVVRAAYVHEYLRYTITEAALADLAGFSELIALGLDPITGHGRGTKSAVAVSIERDATNAAVDPTRGYGVSASLEHARSWLGGTFNYDEYLVEGRAYVPLGDRLVIAARTRWATLDAASDTDLPFSERYFLGGSSSLRGWGRYEVSPLANGLPVGGRTMLDASVEARFAVNPSLGLVVFSDIGNVWPGGWETRVSDVRHAVGPGVRYRTPVGVVRADLGYQLNPVPGLRIDGAPQKRPWRLHFSIGQAF
jgi:outer membrane protein assembly complex protein YaeT